MNNKRKIITLKRLISTVENHTDFLPATKSYPKSLYTIMRNISIFILLVVISFISCGEKTILERSFIVEKPDLMFGGMIVSATPFQIEGKNGKRYIRDKGGIGGINLANPELDKLFCGDKKQQPVNANDILYIEAYSNYTKLIFI